MKPRRSDRPVPDRQPGSQAKRSPARKPRAAEPAPSKRTKLVPVEGKTATLIPATRRESLRAWFSVYMGIEGRAGSDNTFVAKQRDLELFLGFLLDAAGTDHPDQWTRSVTQDFLKHLQRAMHRSPTTVNRVLATLRHASNWLRAQRPFLAGPPCDRIPDLELEDPEWKGLEDIEITRLKSAAEQLLHIQTRANQQPIRNYALFMALHHTGLRISELLALDLAQYTGKHFVNVKRKGKAVTRKVFLSKEARDTLDSYLDEDRGREPGPLLCSRSGKRLLRQNVDDALKAIAGQANATLPKAEQIQLSAHLLRHTFLRKVARKYGVEYAKELAGHTSDRYIWRYVQPSDDEKEAAVADLF
jgi:integrase/recombinase XerD